MYRKSQRNSGVNQGSIRVYVEDGGSAMWLDLVPPMTISRISHVVCLR